VRLEETDGMLQRLLGLADAGPEIPPDGAARVRAALRPAWRAAVRARRRRVAWTVGLAAAAVVLVAVALGLRRPPPRPAPVQTVARLAAARGILELRGPTASPAWIGPGEVGRAVVAGAWLRTGPASRAALRLAGGQSLRLDRSTSVRLVTAETIELAGGAVYLDSGAATTGGVEVRTALGVTREIGTQFEVRLGRGSLTVRAREGEVTVSGAGGALRLEAGVSVTVAADGARLFGHVEPDGPEWGWAREIAPAFAVEGRSVAEFLGWVGRETGLTVSFADAASARFAEVTVLHGTIAGLDPAEAPAIVLPGCGLTHEVAAGNLVVARPAAANRPRGRDRRR
jgi:hypothetical protein